MGRLIHPYGYAKLHRQYSLLLLLLSCFFRHRRFCHANIENPMFQLEKNANQQPDYGADPPTQRKQSKKSQTLFLDTHTPRGSFAYCHSLKKYAYFVSDLLALRLGFFLFSAFPACDGRQDLLCTPDV